MNVGEERIYLWLMAMKQALSFCALSYRERHFRAFVQMNSCKNDEHRHNLSFRQMCFEIKYIMWREAE